MAAAMSRTVALALVAAGALCPACAELVRFDGMSVPQGKTLSTYYVFHVLGSNNGQKNSYVEVDGLEIMPENGKTLPVSSVQVALLPTEWIPQLIGENFCETMSDVRVKSLRVRKPRDISNVSRDLNVILLRVPLRGQGKAIQRRWGGIHRPGSYTLAIANCGHEPARIAGSVGVCENHGYLPANQLNVMVYYGYLCVFYLVIMLAWLGAVERHWQGLLYMQKSLTIVLSTAFCEALCTWMLYKEWNGVGTRHWLLMAGTLQLHTLTRISLWRLLLLTMGGEESKGFYCISALFILQQGAWKAAMLFRHGHSLSFGLLIGLLLVGVLTYAIMCARTFSTISARIDLLEEGKEYLELERCSRTRRVLVLALLPAGLVLGLQVADAAIGGLFEWGLHGTPGDFLPQGVFHLVLLPLLAIWRPQQGLLKDNVDRVPKAKVGSEILGEGAELVAKAEEPSPRSPMPRVQAAPPPQAEQRSRMPRVTPALPQVFGMDDGEEHELL